MFPSPAPSLHPSPAQSLLKISADRKAPPAAGPLLCVSVCPFSLSLYLFLPLAPIISPLLFSPSRRIHPPPLPQSIPTAINQLLFSSRGRLVSAPFFFSLFTVYFILSSHFLSTIISPPVTSRLSWSPPLSSSQPSVFNLNIRIHIYIYIMCVFFYIKQNHLSFRWPTSFEPKCE